MEGCHFIGNYLGTGKSVCQINKGNCFVFMKHSEIAGVAPDAYPLTVQAYPLCYKG